MGRSSSKYRRLYCGLRLPQDSPAGPLYCPRILHYISYAFLLSPYHRLSRSSMCCLSLPGTFLCSWNSWVSSSGVCCLECCHVRPFRRCRDALKVSQPPKQSPASNPHGTFQRATDVGNVFQYCGGAITRGWRGGAEKKQ